MTVRMQPWRFQQGAVRDSHTIQVLEQWEAILTLTVDIQPTFFVFGIEIQELGAVDEVLYILIEQQILADSWQPIANAEADQTGFVRIDDKLLDRIAVQPKLAHQWLLYVDQISDVRVKIRQDNGTARTFDYYYNFRDFLMIS